MVNENFCSDKKIGAIFGPFFGPKFCHFCSKIRFSHIFFKISGSRDVFTFRKEPVNSLLCVRAFVESFWHITSKRYHKTSQFFSMKVFLMFFFEKIILYMFFFEKIILYMLEKFWYGQNLIICGPNSAIFYRNWHFWKCLTYNFQILLWNFLVFMWKLSLWSFFKKIIIYMPGKFGDWQWPKF